MTEPTRESVLSRLWDELFQEIDEWHGHDLNEHHWQHGGPRESVARFYAQHTSTLVDLFGECHGNRLAFYDADGMAGVVAGKAVLYADATVFVSRQKVSDDVSYWLNDVDADQYTSHQPGQLAREFLDDLVALRPLLTRGLAILLPSHVVRRVKHPDTDTSPAIHWRTQQLERFHDDIDVDVVRSLNLDTSTVRLESSERGLMRVLGSSRAVRAQLLEDASISPMSIHVRLPHLRGLALESLIRLREENQDSLSNLRRALHRFYTATPADSRTFLYMLDEVDHGVRELSEAFSIARKKRAWESLGLAAGGVGLLSLYLLSNELGRTLSQALGATSAASVLRHVASGGWSMRHIRSSDFYLAWHVDRTSKGTKVS